MAAASWERQSIDQPSSFRHLDYPTFPTVRNLPGMPAITTTKQVANGIYFDMNVKISKTI